jgi:hypothetical protein
MGSVWESVHHWNADFLAVKWTWDITEFEIKLSRQDLRGEVNAIKEAMTNAIHEQVEMWNGTRQRIRKDIKHSQSKVEKHHHYLVEFRKDWYTGEPQQDLFRPNLFYFAVPNELVGYAVEITQGMKYGVFDLDKLVVAKRATKLHSDEHSRGCLYHLFSRACTIRHEIDHEYIERQLKLTNPL